MQLLKIKHLQHWGSDLEHKVMTSFGLEEFHKIQEFFPCDVGKLREKRGHLNSFLTHDLKSHSATSAHLFPGGL